MENRPPAAPASARNAVAGNVAAARPAGRRRWWLWLLVALAALILAAPYLFNIKPIRNAALRLALVGQDVSVDVERASLGWFSPVSLDEIHVRGHDEEAAVTINSVRGDQSLLNLLLSPGTLGKFVVMQPQVRLALSDPDAGLIGLLRKRPEDEQDKDQEAPEEPEEDEPRRPVALKGAVEVREARLLVSGGASGQEWRLGDVNAAAELQLPEGAAGSTLVVTPGAPLDQVELSPGVCNDLLKFVAPILAEVAQADGKFSLYVDECSLPLGELQRLRVRGKLVIHAAEIGPGALIKRVAEVLGVEHLATAPTDTSVEFSVIGQQVMHEALEFRLGKLRVLTRGTVGFDQSLNLQIEVPMPAHLLKEGPLREALADQLLVLPVRGTLKKPEIDAKALGQSGVQVLKSALQALFPNTEETADATPTGAAAAVAGDGGEGSEGELDEDDVTRRLVEQGVEVGADLLELLRKHRAERQAEREASGTPSLWQERRARRQEFAETSAADKPAAAADGVEAPEPKVEDKPAAPRPRLRDRFRRPRRDVADDKASP